MPDIVIAGNLSEVSAKLRRIKEVIANRVAVGYEPKQHDEEWQYHTMQDERVCFVCGPLHGTIYRGDYLVSDFQFYVSVGPEKVEINSHGSCRCTAEWVNVHEVLVERLCREMENA
jgi:hypothetical protein